MTKKFEEPVVMPAEPLRIDTHEFRQAVDRVREFISRAASLQMSAQGQPIGLLKSSSK